MLQLLMNLSSGFFKFFFFLHTLTTVLKSYSRAFLGVAPDVQKEVYEKTCSPNLVILKFFLSFPQT